MGDDDQKWKFVDNYDVTHYKCGAEASTKVRLKKDIIMKFRGVLTGKVMKSGEIWYVLPGSSGDPNVVFMQDPAGNTHTWDDYSSFWECFELVLPIQ